MKPTTVTTACPFCSGGVSLLDEPSDLTNTELSQKFAGKKVECPHPSCGKTFSVRRRDLTIRHETR